MTITDSEVLTYMHGDGRPMTTGIDPTVFAAAAKALDALAVEVNGIDLDATILRGWPFSGLENWPTDEEASDIQSVHHELMMQDPDMTDDRAWYLAGRIVARIRRDRNSTP